MLSGWRPSCSIESQYATSVPTECRNRTNTDVSPCCWTFPGLVTYENLPDPPLWRTGLKQW